jgi:hypothetical protein
MARRKIIKTAIERKEREDMKVNVTTLKLVSFLDQERKRKKQNKKQKEEQDN